MTTTDTGPQTEQRVIEWPFQRYIVLLRTYAPRNSMIHRIWARDEDGARRIAEGLRPDYAIQRIRREDDPTAQKEPRA